MARLNDPSTIWSHKLNLHNVLEQGHKAIKWILFRHLIKDLLHSKLNWKYDKGSELTTKILSSFILYTYVCIQKIHAHIYKHKNNQKSVNVLNTHTLLYTYVHMCTHTIYIQVSGFYIWLALTARVVDMCVSNCVLCMVQTSVNNRHTDTIKRRAFVWSKQDLRKTLVFCSKNRKLLSRWIKGAYGEYIPWNFAMKIYLRA